MEPSFLEKIAKELIAKYSTNLSDLVVVLPNKRASLFLKQHISKLLNQPIWLPRIIGTEELIEELSDTEIIDNTTQLFELYEVYRNSQKDSENFDEFAKWGQILLHDYNEIDRYLVDTTQLFKHINEARAIEVWNVDGGEITEMQKQYLQFWEQLGNLYQLYTNHLIEKKMTYQGLAYRMVANSIKENPEQFIKDKIRADKLIFAGFNALNKAEEVLITELKKQQCCDVFFDADNYYLKDEMQESGIFMRRLSKKEAFQPFKYVTDKFKQQSKQITIYGIPQNVGQAKYLDELLVNIPQEEQSNTAVVLADENLLVPVLQSIPSNIININVTMGYPLRNTPLNNFFEIYFATIVNAERYGHKQQLTYHYRDLIKLLQLPYSNAIYTAEVCATIIDHIITHNWVFINKEKLEWINNKLSVKLSESVDVSGVLSDFLNFIEKGKMYYLKAVSDDQNSSLELEYLFQYARLFKQITTLIKKYPFIDSLKGFYNLYVQLINSYSIELYGEPLRGLQVLGMLETRNVDFKNIILLSANEGILPAGKTFNSFIPFDIKKAFQLPTHIEKDAIYAYHFYRLIQNAENIHILYNTETNEFGSGEQSRLVTQIENELHIYNPNIKIQRKLITYPTTDIQLKEKAIVKTDKMIAKIKDRFKNGFSPSALASYINCPLDFYYTYIIGVGDQDEVEETIKMNTFGDFVHRTLEIFYKDFERKNITVSDLKGMLGKVNEVVTNVFLEKFTSKELNTGKNLLTLNVAKNYIVTFIKNEMKLIESDQQSLFIQSLEHEMEALIKVGQNEIKIRGKADRIDSYRNRLRIIDYKTGLVNSGDLAVKEITEVKNTNKSKAFQVLMYALMYSKNASLIDGELTAGVISFRKLSSGFMPFKQNRSDLITQQILNEFEQELIELIQEIFDPNVPFTHQPQAKWCKFCE